MKLLRFFLVLAFIGFSLSACDLLERRDRSYQDDPKLGFFPLTKTVDEPVSGDSTVTAEIQLIGEPRDSDLSVSFSVEDSSSASSGTHYSLPSTSATISAGENTTEVTIGVMDESIDNGDTNNELFLTLQESDGVEPGENLKTHTLVIRGLDE